MAIESHLSLLESSGLIRRADAAPEPEYLFRHALIQQAAYSSLLKTDRRLLHHSVGETLERQYPDQRNELAPILAIHFAAAEEPDKAVEYYRLAAYHAQVRYAYQEALQHLQAALDLLNAGSQAEAHSERRLAVLEELADVHSLHSEHTQALQIYQQLLDLWHGCGANADKWIMVRLHRKIIEAVTFMSASVAVDRVEAAMRASTASLEESLRLIEGEPAHVETVRLLVALSMAFSRIMQVVSNWVQDSEAAERYARLAIAMAKQLDLPVELCAALGVLGNAHYVRGELRERLQAAFQQLELSRLPRFGDVRARLNILCGAGAALADVGEYLQAIPYLQEAEGLAEQIHAATSHVYAVRLQVQCWFGLDRWDDLLQAEKKWRNLARRYTTQQIGPICFEMALSASVHAWRGEIEVAKTLREEAYAIMIAVSGSQEKWVRQQHY